MMRHIIPISGKDSLATAIVQQAAQPELEYEYFYNVTGAELPEVVEWLGRVEGYLGQPILRIGADLTNIMYEQGILPGFRTRYCTRLSKIFPMEDYLRQSGEPAIIYYGLRADEPERVGYVSAVADIAPAYPLREYGIDLAGVYEMLDSRDLAPPPFFWQRLWDDVYERLGFWRDDVHKLSRIQRQMLFSWRSRPNCYYCFYQGTAELVGLLEHHPALFDEMEVIESEIGAEGYSFKPDWPLSRIRAEADAIYERKVRRTINAVNAVFDRMDTGGGDAEDGTQMETTCGIFCGK